MCSLRDVVQFLCDSISTSVNNGSSKLVRSLASAGVITQESGREYNNGNGWTVDLCSFLWAVGRLRGSRPAWEAVVLQLGQACGPYVHRLITQASGCAVSRADLRRFLGVVSLHHSAHEAQQAVGNGRSRWLKSSAVLRVMLLSGKHSEFVSSQRWRKCNELLVSAGLQCFVTVNRDAITPV